MPESASVIAFPNATTATKPPIATTSPAIRLAMAVILAFLGRFISAVNAATNCAPNKVN